MKDRDEAVRKWKELKKSVKNQQQQKSAPADYYKVLFNSNACYYCPLIIEYYFIVMMGVTVPMVQQGLSESGLSRFTPAEEAHS